MESQGTPRQTTLLSFFGKDDELDDEQSFSSQLEELDESSEEE